MTHCRRSSSSTLAPSQVPLQSNERLFHPAQCLSQLQPLPPSQNCNLTNNSHHRHRNSSHFLRMLGTSCSNSSKNLNRRYCTGANFPVSISSGMYWKILRKYHFGMCVLSLFSNTSAEVTNRMCSYAPHIIRSVIVQEATDVHTQHEHPACQFHHRPLWKGVQEDGSQPSYDKKRVPSRHVTPKTNANR